MSLPVKGKGNVKIRKFINGQWHDSIIQDVLFVSDLKKNLFSEGKLTALNMETKKSRNRAQIYRNGKLIAWSERQSNNWYKMLFKTVISKEANTTTQSSLEVWHKRLGHLNTRAIKEIISKNLETGVNLDSHEDFFCPDCAYGKQHKEPFQKSERQKMKPGELIHSDVAIMPTPSVGGAKYFVIFKDDHSGYRVVYFMKHKNDTLE